MRITSKGRAMHMRLDVLLVIIRRVYFCRKTIMHHQILIIRIDGVHITFVDQNTRPNFWAKYLFSAHFQDRTNVQAAPVELLRWHSAQDIHPGDHLLHTLHARLVSRTAPPEEVPFVESLYWNILLLRTGPNFTHRNNRDLFRPELSIKFEHPFK